LIRSLILLSSRSGLRQCYELPITLDKQKS